MYGSPPAKAHQMSSGLVRYRSAPSSLHGEACEDFMPIPPSSPDTESMFARFLTPELKNPPPTSSASGGGFPPQPPPAPPISAAEEKLRFASAAAMMYQHQNQNQNQMAPSSSTMAMDHDPIQLKNASSCSNLTRQSSSPAGFFSNLQVDTGYGFMREIAGNNTRLKSQLSYSSSQPSLMSQNESYQINSWEESPILSENNFSSGLKRPRENQTEQSPNGQVRNGLSHQFSLPKTSSEIAAIEKFLLFQDSVPCKIRAKRGFATHPRSIAERVRRTRISERMRKLQELVPNMDKQTNTADMLDLAVDYIKDMQSQVKNLSNSRAKCTCSCSKQKPYTNLTV